MARGKRASNKTENKGAESGKPFLDHDENAKNTTGKVPLSVKVYAPYQPTRPGKEEQPPPVNEAMSKFDQPEKRKWLKGLKRKKDKKEVDSREKNIKISQAEERKKKTDQKKKIAPKHNYYIEKEKRLLMWSGVAFFMIVIMFAWLFNLDYVFKSGEKESAGQEPTELKNAAKEISAAMSELKKGLGEIKTEIEKRATTTVQAMPTDVVSEELSTSTISAEDIMELKEKLESLEE